MQDQDEGQSVIYEDEKKLLQRYVQIFSLKERVLCSLLVNRVELNLHICRRRSSSRVGDTPRPPRPILHILSGAGAGAMAAIATCPLDVVKTRMQVWSHHALCLR
jgi:hypothetical protein